MLDAAKARGFAPECVAFDSWYASLENLKAVRGHGWRWLTQLKVNRQVNPDRTGNRPLAECADRRGGHGRPPAGLRVDPGLQDRLPRRGH